MSTSYQKINDLKAKLKTKMTVNQLADALNCGPRTVFRHLEVVSKENCGLHRFKEDGETYYIIRTEGEANFNQGMVKQLEKIKKAMSPSSPSENKSIKLLDKVIDALQNTNQEDFKPEAVSLDPDYILDYGPFSDHKLQDAMVNKVLKAIHGGFKIRMNYRHSADDSTSGWIEVCPVKIIMRIDTMYLIVLETAEDGSQRYKNYMFENILSVSETNTPFAKVDFNAMDHYKYTFGKWTSIGPFEDVSLCIKAEANWLQNQFRKSHFNPEIASRYDKEKNMIVDMKLRITPDFVTWLLGVSTDLRILKPAHLRKTVKEKLQQALSEIEA
ncbi:MAG: WYL domain-containing protein [Fibrobacter sp.]|nr:WYL domain-containing protein [Fibrobacter sp.]